MDGGSSRFAVIPAKRSASRNPARFSGDWTFLLPSSAEEGRALVWDSGPTPAPGWCECSLRKPSITHVFRRQISIHDKKRLNDGRR